MGHYLPERRVGNAELSQRLGGPVDEVVGEEGPRFRHYAANGEGPSDLARVAAQRALHEAGLQPADLDFLIFATMTPDVTFPGAGCYLQDKLGCRTVGALDLRAQCAGFLFALEVAEQFLEAGAYRRILIAAADVHSSGLDFTARGRMVTPLFGDGAVAVVLGEERGGFVDSVIHTDAAEFERFWCEFPSSRRRPTRLLPEDLPLGRQYPTIDAAFVQSDGLARIRSAVTELLERSGARAREVRRYFFQHVYRRTALAAATALGVADLAVVGGADVGHIASASLAIALNSARESGEVAEGDLVCLATAGAGMNSAAALIRL